jgi:hypothetical protein
MKGGWMLVESLAQLLERDEREAVLGDIAETGESTLRAVWNVCGLLLRRQRAHWNDWRPWIAAFGIAFPFSFPLMGLSVSLSLMSLQVINPATRQMTSSGVCLLLSKFLLLTAWSWTGGFVIGSVSRRTLWVSAVLSLLPCCYCLARFRIEDLSRFCLLLFLLPAIQGVHQGLRMAGLTLKAAVLLASATALLTVPLWINTRQAILNLALCWPAWYLVAKASAKRSGTRTAWRLN